MVFMFSNTTTIQPRFSFIRNPKADGSHMFSNTKAMQSNFSIIRPPNPNGFHMLLVNKQYSQPFLQFDFKQPFHLETHFISSRQISTHQVIEFARGPAAESDALKIIGALATVDQHERPAEAGTTLKLWLPYTSPSGPHG